MDRKGIFSVEQGKSETDKVNWVMIPCMQPCVKSVENSYKIANCVARVYVDGT